VVGARGTKHRVRDHRNEIDDNSNLVGPVPNMGGGGGGRPYRYFGELGQRSYRWEVMSQEIRGGIKGPVSVAAKKAIPRQNGSSHKFTGPLLSKTSHSLEKNQTKTGHGLGTPTRLTG